MGISKAGRVAMILIGLMIIVDCLYWLWWIAKHFIEAQATGAVVGFAIILGAFGCLAIPLIFIGGTLVVEGVTE
jgi:hypothetical protein